MKDNTLYLVGLILVVVLIGVIEGAWQINNPLGNSTTCITHFGDALHFRSLPEFQPHHP